MAKFGFGKNRSMKKPKVDALKDVAPDVPEVPDAPEVPEVDVDELKEQAEDKVEGAVDEIKEKAEDAAGDMKWKMMMAAIKSKLSCCYGGTETSNAGILG